MTLHRKKKLLENKVTNPGIYYGDKEILLASMLYVSYDLAYDYAYNNFAHLKRHWVGHVKQLCNEHHLEFEKVSPILEDFFEQLEFYLNYMKDIQEYLKKHTIKLTSAEYNNLLQFKPAFTKTYEALHKTTDPLGIIDPELRGEYLNMFRTELNLLLSIFKARGIII